MFIIKKLLKILLILVLFIFILFIIYTSKYYKADNDAKELLNNKNVTIENNIITLTPENSNNIGIIFYPGAKVEYISYLPLLNSLTQYGYTCILPKMPFNLAFFNYNIANTIIENNKNITSWYIGGHSLGGAMASNYASKNLDKINGVILLGAYVYGDIPIDKTLVLYGSNDLILNKENLNNTPNKIIIQGGNHAMFGNYGNQKGDGIGEISNTEQQEITINFINDFIKNRE